MYLHTSSEFIVDFDILIEKVGLKQVLVTKSKR